MTTFSNLFDFPFEINDYSQQKFWNTLQTPVI